MRGALLMAAALPACLLLSACGGGGSASTESAQATTQTPPSDASTPVQLTATRQRAGAAAPFVKARVDNSIPTFGKEADAKERAKARASLAAYLKARQDKDWQGACSHLATSVRKGFQKLAKGKSLGCAPVLAALSKGVDLSDPLQGPLLSLRVQGAHGFALFYGPHHQQYIVPLAREGGTWAPTTASAIAYPPVGEEPPR